MSEKHRGNSKHPPWERDADSESVSFGQWLRRQREMREITLREISDASKISLRYLQALEEERFDMLPAQVFAKGFLRQYARYVGLDADEVVNRFLVASQGEEPKEEDDEVDLVATGKRRGGFGGAWKYALLVIAVAAVLLALVYLIPLLFGGEEEADRQPPPGVAPPEASSVPAEAVGEVEATEPYAGQDRGARGESGDAPLRVALDFRDDCWIEAVVDGETEVSEMRVQGESLQLRAQRRVELRLGDAGAVDIEVNGRAYPIDGGSGEVAEVEIDLSDLPGGGPPSAGGTGQGAQTQSAAAPAAGPQT